MQEPLREGTAPAPVVTGPFVTGMTCVVCGRRFPASHLDHAYTCPVHGNDGILDIDYDYQAAAPYFPAPDQPGLWRYRALLPLPWNAPVPPLVTGMTPLYEAPRLARAFGLARVVVKDDSRQPTASFKDRASCLAVALAKAKGAPVVATASTGNAAAALAGMAAAMDQACVIFVPASAPPAKMAQLTAYGARVALVRGTYDQAFDLCMEACRRNGWYNRNTAYNPNMAEGKKTAAFEICEQMGWTVPDAVFVGVGDGCIMAGLHKGFADLMRLGRVGRMPRLYGVQAQGSDFMWQAQEEGRTTPDALLTKAPIVAHTVADSISAGLPRDRVKAMRAVTRTGGRFIRVSDADILAAIPSLARYCGVFAEPAGAACLAGLSAAVEQGLLSPSDTVCLIATGSGLKDAASAAKACEAGNFPSSAMPPTPLSIAPAPATLDAALARLQV